MRFLKLGKKTLMCIIIQEYIQWRKFNLGKSLTITALPRIIMVTPTDDDQTVWQHGRR